MVKNNYLYGSVERKINKDNSVIIPKNMNLYFKDNLSDIIYAKFQDMGFKLIDVAYKKDIQKQFQEESITISDKRKLYLPEKAKEYLGFPKKVMLFGLLDRLEIWNKDEFNKFSLDYCNHAKFRKSFIKFKERG